MNFSCGARISTSSGRALEPFRRLVGGIAYLSPPPLSGCPNQFLNTVLKHIMVFINSPLQISKKNSMKVFLSLLMFIM